MRPPSASLPDQCTPTSPTQTPQTTKHKTFIIIVVIIIIVIIIISVIIIIIVVIWEDWPAPSLSPEPTERTVETEHVLIHIPTISL
jgi:hypothetical protein